MIRVIIVEDEPAIAKALSLLITNNYPDFQLICHCRNGKEGLEQILKEKPELVFTDISMPVMSGLEMIENVKNSGFTPHFIILTVYAEFEYARTAMRLGITDYLLKPISFTALDEIMTTCQRQQQVATKLLQEEYLRRLYFDEVPVFTTNNPLSSYACTMLFLFFGPICSNVYNETAIGTTAQQLDKALIDSIEEEYHISLFALSGHHYNEIIYFVVYPIEQPVNIEEIAKRIYDSLNSDSTYVNLFISDSVRNGKEIQQLTQNIYLFATFYILYGKGHIFRYTPPENQTIHVSKDVRAICESIPKKSTPEILHKYIRMLINFWKAEEVTQFQLITDLRYFSGNLVHDNADEDIVYPDATDIVCTCNSYDELENEIKFETNQIYRTDKEFLENSQQALTHQVRNWLDQNFTSQITYKIFRDLFGMNEKYISTLFKAEYGISPSKYVSELRLNMAKQLMQSNPDILTKDVAELVGFNDSFYFSRVFKLHEGITPSQYLKQLKKLSHNV